MICAICSRPLPRAFGDALAFHLAQAGHRRDLAEVVLQLSLYWVLVSTIPPAR